ncbi:NADH pyrophosphatase [Rhizopus azygosporus]|uniref:NAD-capped RNA hydrolase NUDT12 n=1 Tax=Rhizopus azygosporus TaxID=86630 RepID=A0A367JUD7_RHIAZ|nr:NADH pyrophosphatase [Rhizopus azygosporus]
MSNNVFEAAASGDLDYIRSNLAHINDKNEREWTPLHFAARFGQQEVAKFLKENGADIHQTNSEGKTAAQLAAFWGNTEIANLLQETSTVVRSFPDNQINVFAGNHLNRYGWARDSAEFLSELAKSPRSKYVVLKELKALYDESGQLHLVSYNDVASIVDKVYSENGFNKTNDEIILIFLGIDETNGKGQDGEAYWALDLTPKGKYENELNALVKGYESSSFEFCPTLPRAFTLKRSTSAIIAQAAAMVDWNSRNLFCSACGSKTVMAEGGHKRTCTSTKEAPKCISHAGIQNFAYPRTDAVVIACIIHPNEDKILLGRQKRWPKNMYSCISGFIEAAESLEEAVRREALEETGIIVNRVAYHSSQPWPFPNSLMLGFHAEALTTQISFSDDELESAKWFTRSEVMAAMKGEANAPLNLPFKGSLAYVLVDAWLHDKRWHNKL